MSTPVQKKSAFCVEDAIDSLNTADVSMTSAFHALHECERRCKDVVDFMKDNLLIKEKLEKYGATENVINLFNDDKTNDLACGVCGLENFSAASLEGLTLQGRAEYTKKFMDGIQRNLDAGMEEFRTRVQTWKNQFNTAFKAMMISQAKMLRLVNECDFKNVDFSEEINGISFKDATTIMKEMERLSALASDAVKVADEVQTNGLKVMTAKTKELLNGIVPERKSIKALGWTEASLATTVEAFKKVAYNKALFDIGTNYSKSLDAWCKQASRTAPDSAGKQFAEGWNVGAAYASTIRAYKKCTAVVAKTLYRISLATKAPEESK